MKFTVYTVTNCAFSQQEKDYLKSRGISFEEKNLEHNREYLSEMLAVSNNFAGTPVTKIEKDDGTTIVLKGFTKEEFDKVLADVVPQPTRSEPVEPASVAPSVAPQESSAVEPVEPVEPPKTEAPVVEPTPEPVTEVSPPPVQTSQPIPAPDEPTPPPIPTPPPPPTGVPQPPSPTPEPPIETPAADTQSAPATSDAAPVAPTEEMPSPSPAPQAPQPATKEETTQVAPTGQPDPLDAILNDLKKMSTSQQGSTPNGGSSPTSPPPTPQQNDQPTLPTQPSAAPTTPHIPDFESK